MNTTTSILGRLLYGAAFIVLHLFAAIAVLLYAVTVGVTGLARWCGGFFRRPLARRRALVLAASKG